MGKVILNPVVTDKVLEDLEMFTDKPAPKKRFKLLNLTVEINDRALIFNWAVKRIGFGQITYYLDHKGKIAIDTEGMNDDFVDFVLKKARERYKNGSLLIEEKSRFLFDAFLQSKGR